MPPSTKRKAKLSVDQEALLQAIDEIEKEKGIDRETMFLAVEAALVSAYRKNHGVTFNLDARVDRKSAEITFHRFHIIAETVEDPELQITLEDAKKQADDAELGGKVYSPLVFNVEEFGRIAAQTARQVLVQRIREAERDLLYEEYRTREGEVVTVIVQKVIGDKVILNLDKVEAIMPSKEQIPREIYNVGDRIKVYVVRVRKGLRGPLIIVSRTHPKLVENLFKMEIPEVFDGLIEIKAIVREAGVRTKIAVKSNDANIDPIGACVGVRGSRIRTILKEVPGEKIDIVPWSEEISTFVKNALSPAQVTKVRLQDDGRTVQVVVPDNQLSLAIGKKGQNARLAARLTRMRVDIYSETDYAEIAAKAAKEAAAKIFVSTADLQKELQRIAGVGQKASEALTKAGFSLQKLSESKPEDLVEVEGIGEKRAVKMIEAAKKVYEEVQAERREKAEQEAAGAKAEAEAPAPEAPPEEGKPPARKGKTRTKKIEIEEEAAKEKEIAEKAPPMTFEEALKLFSKRLGESKAAEESGKTDRKKKEKDENDSGSEEGDDR
ncbi:MAG: hypothetical protein A3G34_13985 [Candidatus Lindowbacteria bacterium RIFCSPLOWO2_12_FULL_62_27]|nr:MAG: hypothetical protein A3G34_13985 [Candidatus Lindowbacteria bacterium RIFCSPLOWO2_12_FULL_62_27]